jgi:hypothetical protein
VACAVLIMGTLQSEAAPLRPVRGGRILGATGRILEVAAASRVCRP